MRDKPFGFYFLLFIIIALVFKFYEIIYSFLPAIAFGIVIAYLWQPVYQAFNARLKRETLSALLILLLTFTLFLVPILIVVFTVQHQVQNILEIDIISDAQNAIDMFDKFITEKFHFPMVEHNINGLIVPLLTAGQDTLRELIPRMLMSATQLIISTFIAFFIAFYVMINSRYIIGIIRSYGPLNNENMTILLREMGRDTKTLILGQLLIAVLQGTVAGIGFFIFGVPTAILWAMISVITAFVPLVGAGFIWVPASFYLLISNNHYGAIGLFLWGALVVSTVDNLVRPKLVHMLGKIHPVVVLLGVFIGIKEWGLIGIVIGPLLISVLIHLIRMFREQFLE